MSCSLHTSDTGVKRPSGMSLLMSRGRGMNYDLPCAPVRLLLGRQRRRPPSPAVVQWRKVQGAGVWVWGQTREHVMIPR